MGTSLHNRQFDVAIIGAGINGAAAARELAVAGYSVFLCDRHDFAAGATSRSSRMLHCGLRYFEAKHPLRSFVRHPRRFAQALTMARDGMEARRELALSANVGVQPFTMCFPVYPESSIRGWHLSLGLRLLESLVPGDPPLERETISRNFAAFLPFTRDLRDPHRLQSVTTYREYVFDWPERFCIDAVLEAENAGAEVRNFCSARLGTLDASGRRKIQVVSPEGAASVYARLVLNMAGTEIDSLNATSPDRSSARRLIRGTKGAHIVVRLPKEYSGYGIATLNRLGMPFYCLPSHDDLFYFGPTETPFEGDAHGVAADDRDIEFLLDEANYMLPGLHLQCEDVVFTWAGVRPLTWDDEQPSGRRVREIHDLAHDGMTNVIAMTAGPVMSHRSAARALRDVAEARIGKPTQPKTVFTKAWRISQSCERLGLAAGNPKALRAAIRIAVESEHARDLVGILYTRNAIAWRGHLARAQVREMACEVSDLLGWSDDEITRQTDEFLQYQKTLFRDAQATRCRKNTKSKEGEINYEEQNV